MVSRPEILKRYNTRTTASKCCAVTDAPAPAPVNESRIQTNRVDTNINDENPTIVNATLLLEGPIPNDDGQDGHLEACDEEAGHVTNTDTDTEYVVKKLKSNKTSKKAKSRAVKWKTTGRRGCKRWTKEMDEKLQEAVKVLGLKKWSKISQRVGHGQRPNQCHQHWYRVLAPQIDKSEWTEEEYKKLFKLVQQLGCHHWKRIAIQISGRTDTQCRQRWMSLSKVIEKADLKKDAEQVIPDALKLMNHQKKPCQTENPRDTEDKMPPTTESSPIEVIEQTPPTSEETCPGPTHECIQEDHLPMDELALITLLTNEGPFDNSPQQANADIEQESCSTSGTTGPVPECDGHSQFTSPSRHFDHEILQQCEDEPAITVDMCDVKHEVGDPSHSIHDVFDLNEEPGSVEHEYLDFIRSSSASAQGPLEFPVRDAIHEIFGSRPMSPHDSPNHITVCENLRVSLSPSSSSTSGSTSHNSVVDIIGNENDILENRAKESQLLDDYGSPRIPRAQIRHWLLGPNWSVSVSGFFNLL